MGKKIFIKRVFDLKKFLFFISVFYFFIFFVLCKPSEINNPGSPGTLENLLLSVPSQSNVISRTWKYTFLTNTSSNGLLGGSGGTAGADLMCNTDSAKPADGGMFKAFVSGVAGTRDSNGTDWVFLANQEYKRTDGTAVGTTDANKIFTALGSGLCSGSVIAYAWTGFIDNTPQALTWTSDAVNNCNPTGANPWTDSSQLTGSIGNMGSTSVTSMINFGSDACNIVYPICCIEQ